VAAIANGGTLHTPRFVHRLRHPETGETITPDVPPPTDVPIDSAHFATVREGMRRVMENGTGQWVQIPGVTSGGKTGTAQNPHGEDHSLFIMFAPFDDPEIAIAVAVENAGYGGSAAAPIASLMAEQYLNGEVDLDLWQRRYWIKRLMEEVRSAPPKGFGAPLDEDSSDEPVLNAESRPDTAATPSSRPERRASRTMRLEPIAPIQPTAPENQ
jgi:penicillin-binding protein 2